MIELRCVFAMETKKFIQLMTEKNKYRKECARILNLAPHVLMIPMILEFTDGI
jgi:hypothetical protein